MTGRAMSVPTPAARSIAAVAALVGWSGLALQLVLIVRELGPALGLWRFVGFFTILTNAGAAAVATAVALGRGGPLGGARARLMAATSILMVGIVYTVALQALWNPQGWQEIADVALHNAAPALWLGAWLASPHVSLRWGEIGRALLPPAAYAVYALGRGTVDGWYAYWFLNPATQTAGELLASIATMLAGFGIAAASLVAIDRHLAARRDRSRADHSDEGMAP